MTEAEETHHLVNSLGFRKRMHWSLSYAEQGTDVHVRDIHIRLNDQNINATAHEDGSISLTAGLLRRPWDDIDFVIAHEVGHLHNRHRARGIGPGLTMRASFFLSAVNFVLASFALIGTALVIGIGLSAFALILYDMIRPPWQRRNHHNEYQADLFAVQRCGLESMERFAEQFVDVDSYHRDSHTHPSWSKRLAYVKKHLDKQDHV